jgi:N-acetylmuramoyl-L-alanine amidase
MTDFLPPLLWKASPNFSARGARVDLLILHDCEGGYGPSINWFESRQSQVSAHFVVREDGQEVTQMVALPDKAWHVCDFNSRAVGVEMAGYAKDGFSAPLMLTVSRMFAYLCQYLQIPVRHARGGVGPGIESHFGLGAAGGGHSDPSTSPAFMDAFIAQVQAETNKGDFPAQWVAGTVPVPAPSPIVAPPVPSTLAAASKTLQQDVMTFQQAAGLVVDGDLGPLTLTAYESGLR